ncbi:MAG: hypothetical protein V3V95_08095 [Thermodesulfobacteriota bacterium]
MGRYKIFLALLLVSLLAGCMARPMVRDDAAVREAVVGYIKGKTVYDGGAYIIKGIDTDFDFLHDGVSEKDGYLVSCADFTDGPIRYDIDFYVLETRFGYKVVKTVLHKKNNIELNELLWKKEEGMK